MPDFKRFSNNDLILQISNRVDPVTFNIDDYEPFIDALCSSREYQKEAIRVVLRYFLGGKYANLRQLAEENYDSYSVLKELYRTFQQMERNLQMPDKLACSVDLATATGKSYVMYGIARIMLAHGVVDRVLVICPSRTIEKGLIQKFRLLSSDSTYVDLLPSNSQIRNPHIINANETITNGSICVENYHAVMPHVNSSVRPSLLGLGSKTLVLNDEVHHVYNPSGSAERNMSRWKEFLLDPDFGFHYIAGFSGTCYIENTYFSDVITRYSLHDAIRDGYAKSIEYVAEDKSISPDEEYQKIYGNHIQNKKVTYRKVKPLTIVVTRDIDACKQVTKELTDFLAQREGISSEEANKKVLIVTSAPEHQANVRSLEAVDRSDNPVEWITSVSMLTEGWDVQNVFQIVPHEKRAFNSKLLIAQVMGRGLRIPAAYANERPTVTIFNHASWSSQITQLVDEVMETESRLYSHPVSKAPDYNFMLHHINYDTEQETSVFEQKDEYQFTKGYITLASQLEELDRDTTYVQAITGRQRQKMTKVSYKMFTVNQVAEHIHAKFEAIDIEKGTNYAEKYSLEWLIKLIRSSLKLIGETKDQVSDENRQSLQKAFGVIHREASQVVRHRQVINSVYTIHTARRKSNSIGVTSLRHADGALFLDENSFLLSDAETKAVLLEVQNDQTLPRMAFQLLSNPYYFKTPLNIVITNHKPEFEFVQYLIKSENAAVIDAWIKSTDKDFYSIEFGWRKGKHTKRGSFNPDFFIKKDNYIFVIEIKGDEQLIEPSDENKAKNKAARQHFDMLNEQQDQYKYHFHFLTPKEDYDTFFQFLRNKNYDYFSKLDAVLAESDMEELTSNYL